MLQRHMEFASRVLLPRRSKPSLHFLVIAVENLALKHRADNASNAARKVGKPNHGLVQVVDASKQIRQTGCYSVECCVLHHVKDQKHHYIHLFCIGQRLKEANKPLYKRAKRGRCLGCLLFRLGLLIILVGLMLPTMSPPLKRRRVCVSRTIAD